MSELERQRRILVDAGFTRSPNFLGWEMTNFRGEVFRVYERDLRTHKGSMPARWRVSYNDFS